MIRTQSRALDSPAQTRGHSKGVMASVARGFKNSVMSLSSDLLDGTDSVVDEHASQDEARDLKDPVCSQMFVQQNFRKLSLRTGKRTLISLTCGLSGGETP